MEKTIGAHMTYTLLSDSPLSSFVVQQAKGSFYFNQAWLDLITKFYGYSLNPLTTINAAGQITGFLPLYFIKSLLTGRRLVAIPFSDSCPLLAADEASANELIDQAIHLAQEQKVKYLELRTGSNDVLTKRSDLIEENLYVHWHILLTSPDPDALWSGLRKSVRQEIKKSQKLGVQIRKVQKREDVAYYYQLHLQTRSKKHGMPTQPQRFFFELWDAFAASGRMQILLAEYQEIPIAGLVLLISDTTVRCAFSASNAQFLHLAPNHLLWWKAMEWSNINGYQTFDLGRTARTNEGLMGFKRRLGAIMEPLPYYYYPQRAGLTATSERSREYRLLTACWKHLPLQIAGPLGGYFYKHLG